MARFSKEYASFRTGPVGAVREPDTRKRQPQRIPERLVACLWYSQRCLKDLKTADGRAVSVLSPGVWNLDEGADFLRAAVRVGTEVVRGDIEVHVNSSDWVQHGHHKRPEYDSVALHVVMWNDKGTGYITTVSGTRVPQIVLADGLTRPLARVAREIETDDYPYRKRAGVGECAAVLRRLRRADLARLVLLAGEWRIQEKASRFDDWLRELDFDEALFRAIMEALGYQRNKEAMRSLAGRVPLRVLREFAAGQPASAGAYAIQGALLGVSGLLPADANPAWDDETARFYTFVKGVWDAFSREHAYLPMDPAAWSSGGRPANAPMRRIAAASQWLHRTRRHKLLEALVSILDGLNRTAARFDDDYSRFQQQVLIRPTVARGSAVSKACREARRRMTGLFDPGQDPYWSKRYVLGGRDLAKPVALVGRPRLEEIMINVVIPLLLLYVRRARPELESALLMLYYASPKGVGNKVSRLMQHRLFGVQHEPVGPETAVTRQGLLQLFRDYCSKDPGGCIGCRFLESLEHWLDTGYGRAD